MYVKIDSKKKNAFLKIFLNLLVLIKLKLEFKLKFGLINYFFRLNFRLKSNSIISKMSIIKALKKEIIDLKSQNSTLKELYNKELVNVSILRNFIDKQRTELYRNHESNLNLSWIDKSSENICEQSLFSGQSILKNTEFSALTNEGSLELISNRKFN